MKRHGHRFVRSETALLFVFGAPPCSGGGTHTLLPSNPVPGLRAVPGSQGQLGHSQRQRMVPTVGGTPGRCAVPGGARAVRHPGGRVQVNNNNNNCGNNTAAARAQNTGSFGAECWFARPAQSGACFDPTLAFFRAVALPSLRHMVAETQGVSPTLMFVRTDTNVVFGAYLTR